MAGWRRPLRLVEGNVPSPPALADQSFHQWPVSEILLDLCNCRRKNFLLPWCDACQVSVSVRPARRSATGTTRDSGHHSRNVQLTLHCWLPRLHPLLAQMARPVGSGGIGLSCCPGLAGAPLGREVDAACRGKSENGPRCAVRVEEGRGARHVGLSSAPANVSPCQLVHFARRHYRLAPVVTTRSAGAGADRRGQLAQLV